MDVNNYLTVKQFSQKHTAFKEQALRWIIFKRATNGFDVAFRKAGRKVLIDEQAFFEKLNSNHMAA